MSKYPATSSLAFPIPVPHDVGTNRYLLLPAPTSYGAGAARCARSATYLPKGETVREYACTWDLRCVRRDARTSWSVRLFAAHCHDFACFQASNPSALSCEREQVAPRLHLLM